MSTANERRGQPGDPRDISVAEYRAILREVQRRNVIRVIAPQAADALIKMEPARATQVLARALVHPTERVWLGC